MILGMFRRHNLIPARKTMAKDKALNTWLHDTKATSMYANTFILSRTQTQTQIKPLFSFSDSKMKLDHVICVPSSS